MSEAPKHKIVSKATGDEYEISEWTTRTDIELAEPNFFRTPHGKRETCTFYRGQLIVRNTVQFTGCKPERKTTVYLVLYDAKENKWFTNVAGWPDGIRQAKRLIDDIIKTGEF